ncbi:hypothetical protein [Rhizobium terrae]|uniref:hypothetical protein n=1 Tax=Rhizobium terrae TaxID=2171756 RepID=UPI001D032B55|nr:hypothetical protein [Rhizobium terrae]
MGRHAVRFDRQPIGPEIAVLEDMDAKPLADAEFGRPCMEVSPITQHDDVCYFVIADVAFKIHRPFIRTAAKKVAFLRPPKDHISEADADFPHRSALLFKRFGQQAEKWRGGALEKQERAGFHVTQPVRMIWNVCFGIDGGTALMKIPGDVYRENSQLKSLL